MSTLPYFSVIIPVHNKLPHLERSIHSVLQQTYPNFEVILIDDASTDGSSEKLMEFSHPKLSLYHRSVPGPGGYAARNLGIGKAKYEWVAFLDADDEWKPELLQTVHDTIMANQEQELECVTWGWYSIDASSKILDTTSRKNYQDSFRHFSILDFFNHQHILWTGAVTFKKDLIVRAGLFPESGFRRGGDVDTWIRCLWYSKGNIWINKVLSCYYLDAVNMVTRQVQRDTTFLFTPFVKGLIQYSGDQELIAAIRRFQNRRIYSIIRGQFIDRHKPDYALIRKMNYSNGYFLLLGKLVYNRLKYSSRDILSSFSKNRAEG